MGAAWDRSARDFLKAALEGLADKKKQASLDAAATLTLASSCFKIQPISSRSH